MSLVLSWQGKKIMAFPKEYLDLVLVSGGLLIMFAYNLFHLYKYHKHPKTTELGYENEKKKKKKRVENIMEVSTQYHSLLLPFFVKLCILLSLFAIRLFGKYCYTPFKCGHQCSQKSTINGYTYPHFRWCIWTMCIGICTYHLLLLYA